MYAMFKGLGWLDGVVSPHYNERTADFDAIVLENFDTAYGIENDSAMVFEDGKFVKTLSSGGGVYELKRENGALNKQIL